MWGNIPAEDRKEATREARPLIVWGVPVSIGPFAKHPLKLLGCCLCLLLGCFCWFFRFISHFRRFASDSRAYLRRIDFVPDCRAGEVRIFREGLPRIVARTIQVRDESTDNEQTMDVCGGHGLHRSTRNLLVVHGLSAPRGFAFLLFPFVKLGQTAGGVVDPT